jgi:hypothetical protein
MKINYEILLAYVLAFIFPTVPFLVLIGVLLFADILTGIAKDAKKRGLTFFQAMHSKKLGNTVTKMVMYSLAILLSQAMKQVFGYIPFMQIVGGYICLVEFKSNMENIGEITGIDIWNAIKDKIDGLRKSV